jgi:hypothetical protein
MDFYLGSRRQDLSGVFNKDVKVPLHEAELVGTSSSNTRQGWRGLTTARRSGGGPHDERSGVEDMTQGDWVADVVVGGGALKMFSKLHLKIVPQIVQKPPRKIGFSKEVFARFEVRFDVQQIVPQIVPV